MSFVRDGCVAGGRDAPVATPYSQRRDPDLPWGYWLRTTQGRAGWVVDEAGREWPSVREALWCGRLGLPSLSFPEDQPRFTSTLDRRTQEMSELLIAALSVCGRRTSAIWGEAGADLFEGNDAVWSLLLLQLEAWSLVSRVRDAGVLLTDEGRAVLLMLRATRPPELHLAPPGRRAMDLLAAGGFGHEADTQVDADDLAMVFSREDLAGRPMIVLVDRRTRKGRMPVAETIWSMAFDRRERRDRFLVWLYARTDRWEAWGEVARRQDAAALSSHLLAVYMASVEDERARPLALAAPQEVQPFEV